MRVTRVHVDLPLAPDSTLTLPAERSHHVAKVLRLRAGAPLVVFDGRGGEFAATVTRTNRRGVQLRTAEFRAVERESPLDLRLATGVARGERMDFVVQKAAELGVTRIQPLTTERTVVRLHGERARRRLDHWRSIAIHACEQCGRNQLPHIASVADFADWLSREDAGGLKLVLDPGSDQNLMDLRRNGGPVTLLVGPEGGLSPGELERAGIAGLQACSLGPRTLRTETAVVAGLTAVQLQWGDLTPR